MARTGHRRTRSRHLHSPGSDHRRERRSKRRSRDRSDERRRIRRSSRHLRHGSCEPRRHHRHHHHGRETLYEESFHGHRTYRVHSSSPAECFPPQLVQLETRLPLRTDAYHGYNLIGRLIGPGGSTVKEIETATACRISIVDANSSAGSEPYVLIRSKGISTFAEHNLRCAERKVWNLLNPPLQGYDGMKARQLRELAMARGTYNPRGYYKYIFSQS